MAETLEAPKMDVEEEAEEEEEEEDVKYEEEEEACWPICEAARDSNVADGRL